MISHRMNQRTTVFVLALACSAAWAGEPNEPPLPLVFETGPVTPGPLQGPRQASLPWPVWEPFFSHKAVYAAAIRIVGPAEFLPRPGTVKMGYFLAFAEQQAGLSAQQKTFLEAAQRVYSSNFTTVPTASGRPLTLNPLVGRPDPNGPERVILYAVTLDDAKKMAQAYFQDGMMSFRRQVEGQGERLRELTEKIAQEEKRLSDENQLTETTQKSLDTFAKTVAYRTESEAQAAIGELDRMLNASQVEIAGITAKIKAIQAYRREQRQEGRSVPQEAEAKLDLMFIEESITLRGAVARKQMAMQLREQAGRFVDLRSTLVRAAEEKQTLAKDLNTHREDLPRLRKLLEEIRQQEPQIPDRIVIYPIQWSEQTPGNN